MRMRRKVFALGLTLLMAACVPQASVGPPAGATALPTADVVAVATDQTADPSPTAGATAPATSTAPASEPPEIGPVEGFNDGIVLATADAALVVVYPGTGQVVTLVGPGNYAVDGDNHLIRRDRRAPLDVLDDAQLVLTRPERRILRDDYPFPPFVGLALGDLLATIEQDDLGTRLGPAGDDRTTVRADPGDIEARHRNHRWSLDLRRGPC